MDSIFTPEVKSLANYLAGIIGPRVLTPEDIYKMEPERKRAVMWNCATNLFFLTNNVLRSPDDLPLKPFHKELCETLVHKDPTKKIEEYEPVRDSVILAFRGALKSTIEAADLVQWILCYPDIRILLVSGTLDKAQEIMGMVSKSFLLNETLSALFPQWCAIAPSDLRQDYFDSPALNPKAHVNRREHTINLATFDSVKAGGHYHLIKCDDCTNEINCSTPEMIEKTTKQFDGLRYLKERGCYTEISATIWGVDDLPQILIQRDQRHFEEFGNRTIRSYIKPVWVVRPPKSDQDARELFQRDKDGMLREDDVILAWPEKVPWSELVVEYRSNPGDFYKQRLLNAEKDKPRFFPPELMMNQLRAFNCRPLPHNCVVVVNWDLSGISGKGDYSFCWVGLWEFPKKHGEFGRLFLIDTVKARFTSPTEAVTKIVDVYEMYEPDICRIEDANGSKLLSDQIVTDGRERGIDVVIDWQVPENVKEAKTIRCGELSQATHDNKIQFEVGLPDWDYIVAQFKKFTGKIKAGKNDDALDCLASLWKAYKNEVTPRTIGVKHPLNMPNIPPTPLRPEAKPVEEPPLNDWREDADVEWGERFTVPHTVPDSELAGSPLIPDVPGFRESGGERE